MGPQLSDAKGRHKEKLSRQLNTSHKLSGILPTTNEQITCMKNCLISKVKDKNESCKVFPAGFV